MTFPSKKYEKVNIDPVEASKALRRVLRNIIDIHDGNIHRTGAWAMHDAIEEARAVVHAIEDDLRIQIDEILNSKE